MNKITFKCFSLIFILLMTCAQEGEAKTYAYLTGTDGKVIKIDTDTDTIVSSQELSEANSYVQSGETSVVAGPNGKYLFVVMGRLGSKVLVYDLKTLRFIKDLEIYTPDPDITIFFTPDAKKVFIVWWNTKLEGGAWQFDIFDGITLEKAKTLEFYFFPKQVTFSKDSSMLYAIEGGDWARIKVIDMSTLKITSTIDLNAIWRKDVFAQGVEDVKNEKVLISETDKTKLTDPSKDTLFVNSLETKTSSPRISTGMSGDEKLSPNGTIIFLNEEQVMRSPEGIYLYAKSLGRLHIYDVTTGKSVGFVQFTVDRGSDILGIHPNGNKVYMLGDIAGVRSLIVMDVVNFKVLKTLKVSENILFMIFYEE